MCVCVWGGGCVWGVWGCGGVQGGIKNILYCHQIYSKNKIFKNYKNSNVKAKQKTKREIKQQQQQQQYSKVLRDCFGCHNIFFLIQFKKNFKNL